MYTLIQECRSLQNDFSPVKNKKEMFAKFEL